MLYLTLSSLWKLGTEWYYMASNSALNGPNFFDFLEGEVIGTLRWAQTGGGQPQAVSLQAAWRAVLTLSSTISCCWGTQGLWHPWEAEAGCVGTSGAEQPWGSQWSQGSQNRLVTGWFPGSYLLDERAPALCTGSGSLWAGWVLAGFLPSTPLISAL